MAQRSNVALAPHRSGRRFARVPARGRAAVRGLVLTACVAAAACVAVPEDPIERDLHHATNDPLEPMNRAVFAFNLALDEVVLEPVARGYRAAVPQGGRNAIGRFLANLRLPLTFANDVLQLEFRHSAETLVRFAVNTTVGLAGFFDIVPIEPRQEDFGQTLGRYGIGEGPYLVLPVLGPSSLRDSVGLAVDTVLDPWRAPLDPTQSLAFAAQRRLAEGVTERERLIEEFAELRRTSLDLYVAMRSLYRQRRGNEIRNGAPAPLDFGFD